ncbi:hypothetical protein [Methylovulum sp.]|uniref:hypothetical protein n=1 Tax=Methylovulum sp. TaxID=1916980 RepID=UPI00260331B7|nr:hypothetical protein [Methylovulum sp.]
MPFEGSWIDYLNLGFQSWELTDTSVQAYSVAEYGSEAVANGTLTMPSRILWHQNIP